MLLFMYGVYVAIILNWDIKIVRIANKIQGDTSISGMSESKQSFCNRWYSWPQGI